VPFTFSHLETIQDLVLIEPRVFKDERGSFAETYKRSDYARFGITADFVQDNHSRSTRRFVLRGLHYQLHPKGQGKLVRCTAGEIFDVAVDIRAGSPTFGKWASAILSAQNGRQIWIPVGFAHGLLTLTDIAEVEYKATEEYSPAEDRAIRWDDPDIDIDWPTSSPFLAPRDAGAPYLRDAEINFTWERARVSG
jgi:dTDP-4-dehydrorhamnose 3,5-epimerase